MNKTLLRLADANINRVSEGLRVLEDVARLAFSDRLLSLTLKKMRHSLLGLAGSLPGGRKALVLSRDAARDPGRTITAGAERNREGLADIIQANAKRAQEGLRVLEEFLKLPGNNSGEAKKLRFALYDIEKKLAAMAARSSCFSGGCALYAILDPDLYGERRVLECAALLPAGTIVQLRSKDGNAGKIINLAVKLKRTLENSSCLLLINDRADIAFAAGAGGVHLGRHDLPCAKARELLGEGAVIGGTVRDPRGARKLEKEGADYAAAGPVFYSKTKMPLKSPLGLTLLKKIVRSTKLPVVGIGGINAANIASVAAAGAAGAALISGILEGDMKKNLARLLAGLKLKEKK